MNRENGKKKQKQKSMKKKRHKLKDPPNRNVILTQIEKKDEPISIPDMHFSQLNHQESSKEKENHVERQEQHKLTGSFIADLPPPLEPPEQGSSHIGGENMSRYQANTSKAQNLPDSVNSKGVMEHGSFGVLPQLSAHNSQQKQQFSYQNGPVVRGRGGRPLGYKNIRTVGADSSQGHNHKNGFYIEEEDDGEDDHHDYRLETEENLISENRPLAGPVSIPSSSGSSSSRRSSIKSHNSSKIDDSVDRNIDDSTPKNERKTEENGEKKRKNESKEPSLASPSMNSQDSRPLEGAREPSKSTKPGGIKSSMNLNSSSNHNNDLKKIKTKGPSSQKDTKSKKDKTSENHQNQNKDQKPKIKDLKISSKGSEKSEISLIENSTPRNLIQNNLNKKDDSLSSKAEKPKTSLEVNHINIIKQKFNKKNFQKSKTARRPRKRSSDFYERKQTERSDVESKGEKSSSPSRQRPKLGNRVMKSYLMFNNGGSSFTKRKLPDRIKPNYDIGTCKVSYHKNGFLWGQSRFHFSNYRIQVTFWTLIVNIVQFLTLVLSWKKFDFMFPWLWYSFFVVFIAFNSLLLVDFWYLYRHSGLSLLCAVGPLLNIIYWLIELFGFHDAEKKVWMFGFAFIFVDFAFFYYFWKSKEIPLYKTYNGIVETGLSVVRVMLVAKLSTVLNVYWTAALFPLTGFSIFSTFFFVVMVYQEIMGCVKKGVNNPAGKPNQPNQRI